MESEKPWYESMAEGIGAIGEEVASIKLSGYLAKERQKAGLTQLPNSADQLPPVVDSNGGNLTGVLQGDKVKNGLMIGGAVLLIVLIIVQVKK